MDENEKYKYLYFDFRRTFSALGQWFHEQADQTFPQVVTLRYNFYSATNLTGFRELPIEQAYFEVDILPTCPPVDDRFYFHIIGKRIESLVLPEKNIKLALSCLSIFRVHSMQEEREYCPKNLPLEIRQKVTDPVYETVKRLRLTSE
ncbi:MAG: hypothetical protein AABX11_01445 [Nanoarchaeota archaeon]